MTFDKILKILIPLDGSRLAEAILRVILQIAGPRDLEAVPVRVVQSSRRTLMPLRVRWLGVHACALQDNVHGQVAPGTSAGARSLTTTRSSAPSSENAPLRAETDRQRRP